jgi:RNA polymerase sigma-70 factor (ECF subfamily)
MRYNLRHRCGGPGPPVSYSHLSAAELFATCASGVEAACWQEFINRFNPVIVRSVLRVAIRHGSTERSLIDDLVQDTYLKICADQCKLLRTFIPQGPESAFAFLKVIAANVAQDFFKGRLARKRAPESAAESVEAASVPASAESLNHHLTQTERAVLIDQIDRRLKTALPPEEVPRSRTVFWLYYRSGLTASAIASLPTVGLTTKGVESLLFRMTRLVRESFSDVTAADNKDRKGLRQAESF